MSAITDRLRDLVAEVTTFEEDWEDKLRAALPTYDPCREGFPFDSQDEVRYFELCDDRAAEARDQLQKTTSGIEKVIREFTPQPF